MRSGRLANDIQIGFSNLVLFFHVRDVMVERIISIGVELIEVAHEEFHRVHVEAFPLGFDVQKRFGHITKLMLTIAISDSCTRRFPVYAWLPFRLLWNDAHPSQQFAIILVDFNYRSIMLTEPHGLGLLRPSTFFLEILREGSDSVSPDERIEILRRLLSPMNHNADGAMLEPDLVGQIFSEIVADVEHPLVVEKALPFE